MRFPEVLGGPGRIDAGTIAPGLTTQFSEVSEKRGHHVTPSPSPAERVRGLLLWPLGAAGLEVPGTHSQAAHCPSPSTEVTASQ